MPARAKDGTRLAKLVMLAIPLCRAAQCQSPRAGPGRPPEFDDWKIAVMIMTATIKRRKSKSAQYRFLHEHCREFMRWLGLKRFPARSTYFERYTQAHRLFKAAIVLQGQKAITEGVTTARSVAADKSLLGARGMPWHGKRRCKGRVPAKLHGVDRQADWGYSPYHKWVYGYSWEVLTTADSRTIQFPLAASADLASVSEHSSFPPKTNHIPKATRFVLVDSGYDSNAIGDAVELDESGRHTGHRFVCPPNRRGQTKRRSRSGPSRGHMSRQEREAQTRRRRRIEFYDSPTGRKAYARRGQSVEPLHERVKSLFELDKRVWHRGLGNNKTQLLSAIFCYQLLLRFNHRCGRRNAQVQWIMESV
jgi:hypothetical protein